MKTTILATVIAARELAKGAAARERRAEAARALHLPAHPAAIEQEMWMRRMAARGAETARRWLAEVEAEAGETGC